ncbi:cell division protein FtsX [Chachezhania antarctica]|uniref:cell division protein FtsX n=1 Tax=Chachezhania antarctica TaxID=2340860 RepID=UPI000EB031F3|nr:cell division protein FtsX [Chachezhania antarctica]
MIRAWFLRIVLGDAQADRIVPPSGHTALLTLFASGAMAFLAVFALALSVASTRLSDRWATELAGSATLRIAGQGDARAEQTARALEILSQTPGIARARALSEEEQTALLAPWFGAGLPVETLPLPQLVEIIADDPPYDLTGLRLRLEAEVPDAVLDDHGRWREPLVAAAGSLWRVGMLSLLLIGGTMAAMITLAAYAALSANAQVISVLRLVGAQDTYIAGAFVRRFTLRALFGAILGTALGVGVLLLMPSAGPVDSVLSGLGFSGAGWLWLLVIPILAAAVAMFATMAAARARLRSLS